MKPKIESQCPYRGHPSLDVETVPPPGYRVPIDGVSEITALQSFAALWIEHSSTRARLRAKLGNNQQDTVVDGERPCNSRLWC